MLKYNPFATAVCIHLLGGKLLAISVGKVTPFELYPRLGRQKLLEICVGKVTAFELLYPRFGERYCN